MTPRPRVLIVGAGFAGLNAGKALRTAPVDVTIIDQNNYHTFQPLLYQVATAGLDTGDIAHQVRGIFRRQPNVRFRQGTVERVDWGTREVGLADGDVLPFDYLVLAAGATYNDFGVPGVKRHGFLLKSLTEASSLRSHILRRFEEASADPGVIDRGALTFVLVGAGPTGVEMAGALTELFERALPGDYPELDVGRARVVLLEMTDEVLPPFGARSRAYAASVLRRRGVDVRLGATVEEVRGDGVVLASGEVIATQTLVWAAGVRGHPLVEALGLELGKGFRVPVEADLSLPEHPFAFAVGDLSGATDDDGAFYPQVAQVAIQQGTHAARAIRARLERRPADPFHYRDRGIMAIIGRNAGVAELSHRLGGLELRGFLGWLGWLLVHLIYLPGFKNRFSTLASWAYNYLTFDRHARLILDAAPSPAEVADRRGVMTSAPKALHDAPASAPRHRRGQEGAAAPGDGARRR